MFNIVLPYIRSAREGVSRLGELIEKHGIAEGFSTGFVEMITIQINPLESGVVQDIVTEEGSRVKKDDVILVLSNENLDYSDRKSVV